MVFITIIFEKDIRIYYYFLYRNMNETEQNRIALLLDAEDEFECSSDVDDDEEADRILKFLVTILVKVKRVLMKKKTEKSVIIFMLVEII